MHYFANQSSFGARAISGAYLLPVRPCIASPGVGSGWGRGPDRQRDSKRYKRR